MRRFLILGLLLVAGAANGATVTAYVATGQVTASGRWPVEGRTVAGPRWIPLGTRVYIQGVGWRIVEDRTHLRFNGRFDVYMGAGRTALLRAKQFGKQQLEVK